MVQSILNHTKLVRLGNKRPLTLFTGISETDPISSIAGTTKELTELKNFGDVRAAEPLGVAKNHDELEKKHRNIAKISSKKKNVVVELHNKHTGVLETNLDVGNYFLRRILRK